MAESRGNEPIHGRQGAGRAYALIQRVNMLLEQHGGDHAAALEAAHRIGAEITD